MYVGLIKKLEEIGWSADGVSFLEKDTIEDTEALVHELAHNLIAGGKKELNIPKNPHQTATLVKTRVNQNKDELLATAATILVCRHLGFDVQKEALQSAAGNLQLGAGKYDGQGLRSWSKDNLNKVTRLVEDLIQTKRAVTLSSQIIQYLNKITVTHNMPDGDICT